MEQVKQDIQRQITTGDDISMGDNNFEDSQSINSVNSEELAEIVRKAEEKVLHQK